MWPVIGGGLFSRFDCIKYVSNEVQAGNKFRHVLLPNCKPKYTHKSSCYAVFSLFHLIKFTDSDYPRYIHQAIALR